MPWHPPIPTGKLYSEPALQLGPALAMLVWCYDGVKRDGQIEVRLDQAAVDIGVSYRTIRNWWQALREGPFFSEEHDRGRQGWIVKLAEEWIDWHVMGNNYQGKDVSSEKKVSKPDEGQNVSLEEDESHFKAPSKPDEGQDLSFEQNVYKEDQHDHKSGIVASRKMRSQRPQRKTRDPTPAIVREALADVCGFDLSICSKENAVNVNVVAKRLFEAGQKAGKTTEETAITIRYVASYFAKHDWRGKKGDRPTPKQLVDVWGAAIAERNRSKNGHTPLAEKPRDILTQDELLRRVAAKRGEHGPTSEH